MLNQKTQPQAILEYLQSGKTLTGLDALYLFKTMKLASRISELRAEGHDIKDETIHDPITGKHYKKYWMIPQPVYFVKEHGQLAIF